MERRLMKDANGHMLKFSASSLGRVLWKHRQVGTDQSKLKGRWGYGLFVGVKWKRVELIVVDEESKKVKFVRTARRIPEEARWHVDSFEWLQDVPWNAGAEDTDTDGVLAEFDVKQGPQEHG